MIELVVVKPGVRSLIQDGGRLGYLRVGVTESGAYDRGALAAANRAVGNDASAAGIECLLGGLELRCRGGASIAVTGARAGITVDGESAMFGTAIQLVNDGVLRIGRAKQGLRSYLAVSGGIDGLEQLGSQSTDTMSGIGPAPLAVGDQLSIGQSSGAIGSPAAPPVVRTDNSPIRVTPGPHDDLLAAPLAELLNDGEWVVSPSSDRIGLRLTGPALPLTVTASLPSEPTLRGAIQVPPDGQPVILGPDRPTTGGYPVVGVVIDADLDRLAQLRPGTRIVLAVDS